MENELKRGLAHYAEIPPFVAFGYEPKTTFWGEDYVIYYGYDRTMERHKGV